MCHARRILMLWSWFAFIPSAMAQQPSESLPRVVQHSEPTYPPLARQTRIQGEVRVKLTTDGESVCDAVAETGHPLLLKAAEENARTWKFVAHAPNTFHVTFRYKLLSDTADVEFLETPAIVQIAASPPQIIIDYAWIGLGTWKAQFKSAHGKTQLVFDLSYSGPDGDWLAANFAGPDAENEEINYGHREGNFVAFTNTFRRPNGKHVKTFFVGKMSGDKIVGTSVDETGTRGQWTAVRTTDIPRSR